MLHLNGLCGQISAVAFVSGLVLSSMPARAEFLVWGVNVNAQTVGATPTALAMSIPPLASGVLDFTVPSATPVIITFSAECSVSGTGFTTYANIDIQVDKAPRDGVFVSVPPTNSDDALCTANNTAAADGWLTASRTVVDTVPKGTSSVRVVARTIGGTGTSRLDDLALLVAR